MWHFDVCSIISQQSEVDWVSRQMPFNFGRSQMVDNYTHYPFAVKVLKFVEGLSFILSYYDTLILKVHDNAGKDLCKNKLNIKFWYLKILFPTNYIWQFRRLCSGDCRELKSILPLWEFHAAKLKPFHFNNSFCMTMSKNILSMSSAGMLYQDWVHYNEWDFLQSWNCLSHIYLWCEAFLTSAEGSC